MAKLTDKQRKQIIAERAQGATFRELANKYHVSSTTIHRTLTGDPETEQKVAEKKRENTKDILEHMKSKTDEVCEIIDVYLDVLPKLENFDKLSPNQITTALGTLIDKFAGLSHADADDRPYELPARVMGKAFVDIHRQIEPNKTYRFKGGRGGLKSSYISLCIVELIKNNPQIHACVVRKVAATLKDSVYAQMQWAIHELGLDAEFKLSKSPLEITYTKTGQKIYFRGVDDPMKLKGIKPPFGYVGILWKEELDQLAGPSEERNVNQSVLRGGPEAYDFSSFNPPKSRSSWVNQLEIDADENTVFHESTYLDAPPEWLGQKFIDDAEHLEEVNPEAYEHEYLGIPNGDGGNVFEYVEMREITDAEIEQFDRIYQGVDWGYYPDPFAFVRLHYDAARETIYLIDEHYENKESNAVTGQWIIDQGYTDFDITCDSAEPKSINDYRDMGIVSRGVIKGPGSVEYGMKWLQNRKIVADPRRTPEALREITTYEYDRDRDGNVISGYPDADNHAIDAIRYALSPLYNRRGNSA